MRQSKAGELTQKDMSVVKEADSARDQIKKKHFVIRDYSLNHRVEIMFDLNEEAERDQIFRLRIDGIEVLLDNEEVLRVLRWI